VELQATISISNRENRSRRPAFIQSAQSFCQPQSFELQQFCTLGRKVDRRSFRGNCELCNYSTRPATHAHAIRNTLCQKYVGFVSSTFMQNHSLPDSKCVQNATTFLLCRVYPAFEIPPFLRKTPARSHNHQ
jgi:hypothetical protein